MRTRHWAKVGYVIQSFMGLSSAPATPPAPPETAGAAEEALALYEAGDFPAASLALTRYLAETPQDAAAHALLSLSRSRLGLAHAARASAERAVACGPDLGLARYALAVALLAGGDWDRAGAEAQVAAELDPEDTRPLELVAAIRVGQGRPDEALAAADAGLSIDPDDAQCATVRGLALCQLGRVPEAEDALAHALSLDRAQPLAHTARGWLRLSQNDVDRAAHSFAAALDLNASDPDARAGLREALKAQVPFYRPFILIGLWGRRAPTAHRVAAVLCAVLAARLLFTVADALAGWALPGLLACGLVFGLSSHLSDLLLGMRPLGRPALTDREWSEAKGAALFGVCALVVLVAWGATGDPWSVLYGFLLMILASPLVIFLECRPGLVRIVGMAVALVATVAAVALFTEFRGMHLDSALGGGHLVLGLLALGGTAAAYSIASKFGTRAA